MPNINANNDYDYKLLSEYEKLLNEAEMGIRELGDISSIVDLNALNLCNNQDEINGILANMNPNAPTTIEEMNEILESMNNLLDPNFTDKLQNEINDYLNGDMSESDLDVDAQSDNYAIIEFGSDYINGDAIQYELFVKPGQKITANTIIGQIYANDKWMPIHSIFSSGTVMSIDLPDGEKDFYRLYSESTDRHIIIHPYETGSGTDLALKDVNDIQSDIKLNGYLYTLLKDNMIYSLIPFLLSKMETLHAHRVYLHNCNGKQTVKDVYNKIFETKNDGYDDVLKKYQDEITSVCNPKTIKETGGKQSNMDILGNKIMDIRERILLDCINIYNQIYNHDYQENNILNAAAIRFQPALLKTYNEIDINISSRQYNEDYNEIAKQNVTVSEDDPTYPEKYAAAYQAAVNSSKKEPNITYYDWLIKNVDTSDEDNVYALEYVDLLNDINNNRPKYIAELRYEYAKKIEEIYQDILNYIEQNLISINETTKLDFQELYTYLYNEKYLNIELDSLEPATIENDLYDILGLLATVNKDSDTETGGFKTKNEIPEYITEKIQEISILYVYEDDYKVYRELVKLESNRLYDFWQKMIAQYQPMSAVIDSVKEKTAKMAETLTWPTGADIVIDGINYKHYLFKNPLFAEKNAVDGDESALEYNEDQEIDLSTLLNQTILPPDEDESLAALANASSLDPDENDLSANEITVYDTEYWVKYFSLATIITLPPIFWADGFDIPPWMIPVPMPGIYICFYALPLKELNMVLVFGLGIRGIYIYPLIQCVNTSSLPATPLTPLVTLLNKIRDIYMGAISKIENFLPNIAGALLLKLQQENSEYQSENEKLESMLAALTNQAVEGRGQIKKLINKIAHPNADHRMNTFRNEMLQQWDGVKQIFEESQTEEEIAENDSDAALTVDNNEDNTYEYQPENTLLNKSNNTQPDEYTDEQLLEMYHQYGMSWLNELLNSSVPADIELAERLEHLLYTAE